MKKKITIAVAIATVIVGMFSVIHSYKIPISIKRYYEQKVAFNYGEYLRNYIQYTNPDVVKIAQTLKCDTEERSIIRTYNWLEQDYHYVMDNDISWSNGVITIYNHTDYWQTPILSLSIIKQTGGFYGDCEDGSILLETLLRAEGYKDVYLVIGTVSLSSGIYGHAWVQWKDYLLETTRGEPLDAFRKIPPFYSPSIMTNGDEVKVYAGVPKNLPVLTPTARKELLQKLAQTP